MNLRRFRANRFGAVSFAIALLKICIIIFTTVQDFQLTISSDLSFTQQYSYITWFLIISWFIGLVLGIIGLIKKEERNYAVNGVLGNIIFILFFIIL